MLNLFKTSHSFILLLAPPAMGKTSYLLKLLTESKGEYYWVFVSPLKALANEFLDRVKGREDILVKTAESLVHKKYEYLFQREDVIFVLDEFHLVYFWGTSFRETLFFIWRKIATSKAHGLGLTATYTQSLSIEADGDILRNFSFFYKIDCGNLTLKNAPCHREWIPREKHFSWGRRIEWEIIRLNFCDDRIIIFVPFRGQVDYWLGFAREMGIMAIGCKGGEVMDFTEKLKICFHSVRVIISTSCLSHGVNLPVFQKVLITYEVSESFWIQMTARAGRRGESYKLISCKKTHSFMLFLLRDLATKIKLCFWKELSFINKLIKKEM